ncbi:MAG: lysozyme inhibitor LprI family protein [Pseudorhodoplanes sp.]|nr:lysozyme inhibitor LprI family protein [Pseudorhodoplanes sp.]
MVKCLADATAKWDKRLNEAYRETLKEGPREQREQLRKAQRLWLQYRDANCDYYGLSEGSIARVLAASCLFDMTKARAKELEAAPGN